VGYFGEVHEGPVGIHKRSKVVYEANMVVTNEPGYYEDGKFGIRIENLLVVGVGKNNML
jgi:Xaa-Pro aminopeptidase